jgi:hypothetical protein
MLTTAALKSVSKVVRAEVPTAMVAMSAAKVAVDAILDLHRPHRVSPADIAMITI